MTTSSSSTTSASTTTTTTTSTSTTTTKTTTTTSTATTTTTTTVTTTSTSTSTTTTTTTTTTTKTTSTSTSTTTVTTTTTTMSTSTSTSASTTTCSHYLWNQTGVVVAGTGVSGSTSNQFATTECLVIDANKTLYVCDHHNHRIQKWLLNATNGSTVAGTSAATGASDIGDPQYLVMDRDGYLYITGHVYDTVLRISPITFVATVVAGTSSSGSAYNQLDTPTDMLLDDYLNLYVVDSNNKRLMKWPQNSTTGTVVISNLNSNMIVGIQFASNSKNEFYLSDEKNNRVYLWEAGASTANITLNQVNSTSIGTLTGPHGITTDSDYNLYVADSGNNRVVLYCANSRIGIPVVGESGTTPTPIKPMDVAFDSDFNLYVALYDNKIVKYARL
ncbi:unnamed protein product [Rotaria sp. Silwood1]|nr:unnamed protein product [Rotaria sp. Silwood1]CAF3595329.1 unnamed protein product [Rotaria sp. Silwood1]CAF3637423.1 unnamed protein product [Rotaria sp. Silwood1]